MTPQFPLRIIYDDGDCTTVERPEDLLTNVDTIDSADPQARLWIRDALDRTVRLRMRAGEIEVLEVD